MNGVHARKVIAYATLPGVIPRARRLFASGFGYIAFLMANIYNMVRLLPSGHPYMQPRNIGKFGIHHVVGEAANNLVFSRKNADQILLFFALLAAIVLLFLQVLLALYGLIVTQALAGSYFNTPNPTNDIAFLLLDNVFGIPDLFCNTAGTCTSIEGTLPWPFHVALQRMFQFYSLGLLVIGALIFLYFVVVVVAETAVTGTPFGQRFQNIWVPIRLVMALGLLIPLNYGMNAAQYITLYSAKMGSGFATNAWITFNNTIASRTDVFAGGTNANPLGERSSLLARPKSPDITPLVQFISLAHACAYAYWKIEEAGAQPPAGGGNYNIRPYFVKTPASWMSNPDDHMEVLETTTYLSGLDFYDNADILIVFGVHDPVKYTVQTGNVMPYCGEMRIKITDLTHRGTGIGADGVQDYYFELFKTLWFGTGPGVDLIALSGRYVELYSQSPNPCSIGCGDPDLPACGGPTAACHKEEPKAEARQSIITSVQSMLNARHITIWNSYNSTTADFQMTADITQRGWGGAGIWFNKIAQMNGGFISAITQVPSIDNYPLVMEQVSAENMKHSADFGPKNQYRVQLKPGQKLEIQDGEIGVTVAQTLAEFFYFWNDGGANQANTTQHKAQNFFYDLMNLVFGTTGLISMREENAHIHPLAQLSALGKGLVDSAIRNLMISTLGATMGGPAEVLDKLFGTAAAVASSFLGSTAFLILTAGVILFYVLPFLPFLYFFFTVGTWIKTIFEAMVGVPLWALAHLRIDGEGLPGDAASNGYYLIFEIFLRPILSIFGLVAAMIIFTAQVRVLNFTWDLVVNNLTGFEPLAGGDKGMARSIVDEFFFTIIYAVVVYMMAIASFKMIDDVPDNLMRWMGAGVNAFSDINDDATEGLTRYAAMGGITIGKQVTESITNVARGVGGELGVVLGSLRNPAGAGSRAAPRATSEEP